MKRSQFMILDYPHLVKYFASKNPVQLFLYVMPLWVFSIYVISKSSVNLLTLLAVVLGAIYWTFLEYVIHRYAYHTPYKSKLVYYFLGSFHLYHHKDMSDHRILNAGPLMIYVLTPTVLSPVLLVTRDPSIIAALTLGLSMTYYFYEWVHFILHYKVHETGYLNYIQKYHFHHHDHAPHSNFGNTSHFWDVVFGSYDARYVNYVMSPRTRSSLITEVDVKHALT